MLLNAMFLDPGGPPWRLIVLAIAAVGIGIGVAWIWRISSMGEDPKRSFFRSHGRRGGIPRIPLFHAMPTARRLLTRGAIVAGFAAAAFAVVGPLLLRPWVRALELSPIAGIVWVTAIVAAAVGTTWMLRIAKRDPEDGSPSWRYRS